MGELVVNGVKIEHFGHASFRISYKDYSFYIDPYIKPEDGKKTELILTTHEHFDHCADGNIRDLLEEVGSVVAPGGCFGQLKGLDVKIVAAGDEFDLDGVAIKVVPAYNVNKFRAPNEPFHPKGLGVGYLITVNKTTIYHAGDTDFIPEMKKLGKVDVALLPIGGFFTMDFREAAQAANTIRPKIAIPMHYSTNDKIKADPNEFKKLVDKSVRVEIV
ncbi:MAG: metal-dependent hydrolase [Candidatus Aenigmarchaeota archaeon]|nr:metal-dependent hydrolase [Candidatus Aenigmarchaeota archaeon]